MINRPLQITPNYNVISELVGDLRFVDTRLGTLFPDFTYLQNSLFYDQGVRKMEYVDNPVNIAAFALLVFLFVQERSTVRKAFEN